MKFKKTITILLLTVASSVLVYALSTGITGVTLKGSNPGCLCHNAEPSGGVTVTINGPDQMLTDETASFTLTITGGPLNAGGTNIAASAGNLEPGAGLQKISGELTHTIPKASQEGVVSFEFTYTAPSSAQTVTLFANGNSVNFNGNNIGDQWNFAPNKTITVESATDVNDDMALTSFSLGQNYPNPFNPSTKIRYTIPNLLSVSDASTGSSLVMLKVYNTLGKEVALLVNEEKAPGIYEVDFNADILPSGVYYYILSAGNFSETKKMMLLK
jgi:hypothetical protein